MSDKSGAHRAIDPSAALRAVEGKPARAFTGVPPDLDLARLSRHIAVAEFAASMAHEMRQPLTAIIGNAQTCRRLLHGTAPDVVEIDAALNDIVDAGNRADQLLQRNRDLLSPQPANRMAIDFNAVVTEVTSMARARLQINGVRLSTALGDLPAVNGDRRELLHLLLILIANAIDAMSAREPAGGGLEIATRVNQDGLIEASVADTGPGINAADFDRVFTPFFTTKASSLGVGLSIGRSIIERHGGRLWVEPNGTEGARFHFTLPKWPAVAGAHAYP